LEISAPQCHTDYSRAGNGDVLDNVFGQNISLSDVIVSDIVDADQLLILLHIMDHEKFRKLSDHGEKFTDRDQFQSLAPELPSLRIEINKGVKADKSARDFTAYIASAFRMSSNGITLSDINSEILA
jgi:hypothetical protein